MSRRVRVDEEPSGHSGRAFLRRSPRGFLAGIEARETGRDDPLLYLAFALSLLAALSHLWAMPEHMGEWWGYGAFFLASAVAQGAFATGLMRWPRRSLFLAGIGGNLSILVLYAVTRTVGIPFFGPHAGEVEGVGLVDLCATASEIGIVLALGVLATKDFSRERKLQVAVVATAVALLVAHLIHLLADGATTGHGP